MTYKDSLIMAVRKLDYQKAMAHHDRKPLIGRIADVVLFRMPKDPCKKMTPEGFALQFTNIYNQEKGLGKRVDTREGDSIRMSVGYNAATMLPVVTVTLYQNGCYFQERKAFQRNGSVEEWGCAYPLSECGLTGLPDNIPEFAKETVKKYRRIMQEMKDLVLSLPAEE